MSRFFIERPIFAWVVAIVIMLAVLPIMVWNIRQARAETRGGH